MSKLFLKIFQIILMDSNIIEVSSAIKASDVTKKKISEVERKSKNYVMAVQSPKLCPNLVMNAISEEWG